MNGVLLIIQIIYQRGPLMLNVVRTEKVNDARSASRVAPHKVRLRDLALYRLHMCWPRHHVHVSFVARLTIQLTSPLQGTRRLGQRGQRSGYPTHAVSPALSNLQVLPSSAAPTCDCVA